MAKLDPLVKKEHVKAVEDLTKGIIALGNAFEKSLAQGVKLDKAIGKQQGIKNQTERQKSANKTQTEAQKIYKQNQTTLKKLEVVNGNYSKALIKSKTELSKQTAAIKANQKVTDSAKGSFDQLDASLKRDIKAFKALSAEERKNSAEGRRLQKSIKDTQKDLKGLNKDLGKGSKMFAQMKVAMIAFASVAGIKKLMGFLSGSLDLFDKEIIAQTKLKVALGYTSEELLRQADALQERTRFGNEAIIEGQAFLAQMKLEEDQIKKITPLILDFAAGYGFEVNNAFQLVAKTLGSTTNALSRYGIVIEGAAGSNERLESAMHALSGAFEGNAEALALIGKGPLEQLSNLWGDMREQVGSFVAVALNPLVKHFQKVLTPVKSLTAQFKDQKDKVEGLQKSVVPLIYEYETLTKKGKLSADEQTRLNTVIVAIGKEVPTAITKMDEYGRVMGISATKAREFITAQQDLLKLRNAEAIEDQTEILEKLRVKYNQTASSIEMGFKTVMEKTTENIDGAWITIEKGTKIVQFTDEEIAAFRVTMAGLGEEMLGVENVLKLLTGEMDGFAGKEKKVGDEVDIVKGSMGDLEAQLAILNTEKKKIILTDEHALRVNADMIKDLETLIELAKAPPGIKKVDPKKAPKVEVESKIGLAEGTAERLKEIDDETTDHIIANKGRIDEADSDAAIARIELAGWVASSAFDLYQQTIDNQLSALMMQKEFELGLAEGNQEAQAAINAKFAKKEAALKRKQAVADKSAALFQAAINTAVAITAATTAGPGIGIALAIITAAFNAIQLGVIASKPIPAFKGGTKSSPEGWADVGEIGHELLIGPGGDVSLSGKKRERRWLERGTQVIPNKQTEGIIAASGYDSKEVQFAHIVEQLGGRLEKAIKNKKEYHFDTKKSKITEREGSYYKTYLNAKI